MKIDELYRDGKSLPEIAKLVGSPISNVRGALLRMGVILRTRGDALRVKDWSTVGPRHFSDERKAQMSEVGKRNGKNNSGRGAGVSKKKTGYSQFTRGENKHRPVHTVIFETRMGRRVRPDEVIHHVDGDPSNNNENNLALMTRSGHARLHRREQRIAKGGVK